MSLQQPMPDFDELADSFWRLGVMCSPAQLQGYLLGILAVGFECRDEQWLQLAAVFIDPVESPAEVDNQTLLELLHAAQEQLQGGGLDLQLLLPGDDVEISLRVDALGQWCQGFLAGFAYGGKQRQDQGPQQFSAAVKDVIRDIGAISQVALGDGDEDEGEREKSFFELTDYLRLAAINIFLETSGAAGATPAAAEQAPAPEQAIQSAADLFAARPDKDKLH